MPTLVDDRVGVVYLLVEAEPEIEVGCPRCGTWTAVDPCHSCGTGFSEDEVVALRWAGLRELGHALRLCPAGDG